MRLDGRVAIVTGGGRGIGRGICQRLAEEGADVVIFDRRQDLARETADTVRERGRRALPLLCNIRHSEEVQAAFARAVDEMGKVDLLVNNAGGSKYVDFLDTDEDLLNWQLELNLKGAYFCSREAATYWVANGIAGRIVCITSGNAERPTRGMALYSVAKGGLQMLARSMALELAPYGIRVNSVRPSARTPQHEELFKNPEYERNILAGIPLGRTGTPRDIGNVVAFLLSDNADFVTGADIEVEGGSHLGRAIDPTIPGWGAAAQDRKV